MRPSRALSARTGLGTALLAVVLVTPAGLPATAAAPAQAAPAAPSAATTTLAPLAPKPADTVNESYGVATHIAGRSGPYGDTARVTAALTALGARHIRTDLSNIPDQWAAINRLHAAGVRSNLIMGAPDRAESPLGLVDIIASKITPGAVASVEGANEWNLSGDPGWPVTLRAHQAKVYAAVKGNPATAHLPVLAPSLGKRAGFGELGDLTALADLGNAHLYSGGDKPSVRIDEMLADLRLVTPGKPVVFTEAGYHNAMRTGATHFATPESVVGTYLPRLLLEHFSRGTKRMYSYQLLDEGGDPGYQDHEAHFGLLRQDWSPKPSYTAMQNLLRLTADPGGSFALAALDYRVTGATPEVRQQLLQKRDGSYQLVLWRDVQVYDPRTQLSLPVAPLPVQVDLAGTADVSVFEPSTSAAARTTLRATSQVQVPLDGDLAVVTIKPAPASPTTLPGAPTTLPALPSDAGAVVRWNAPTSGGAVTGYRVTASPGGATRTAPAVSRTVSFDGLVNGTAHTFTVAATGPAGTGPVSSPTALVVPNAPAGRPGGVTAEPRDGAAVVSWTAPTTGGPVSGYQVVATRGGASAVVAAGTTSARVSGLENGRYYSFTVVATGPGGAGPVSAASTSVRPMPLPGAVRSFSAAPGNRSAQLAWSAPTTGGPVRQYLIQGLPGGAVRTVPGTVRSVKIYGLVNGMAYTFRITPVSPSGNGPSTSAATVRPRT